MEVCTGVQTSIEYKDDWTIHKKEVLLSKEGQRQYQAAIGSLINLMSGTRPDLSYSVNKLARYCSTPTERHWRGLKRIMRFVKETINTSLQLGNVMRH